MKRQTAFQRIAIALSLSLLLSQFSFSQAGFPVTGKITDADGAPLEGVTVQVKGTSLTTATQKDGTFHINAPSSNTVLRCTYVGYEMREIRVNNRSRINLSLVASTNSMDEVVVIGYGTSKRRDVTGAVSSFNTKNLDEKPNARIDQAMIGQMPGVQIRQQTGMPGAGFSILVRGAGSISAGTEPLYVIDGFPLDVEDQNSAGGFTTNPLDNLNPSDIESIQVLKDAAAAAIYGSRAANGVVIITTKRGQAGRTRVTVNGYAGVSKVAKKMDVLSAGEWADQATEIANDKWVASGTGRTADQTNEERRAILGLAPGAYNTNYMADDRWSMPGHPGLEYVDWQDSAFRVAPFQNYEISAGGGSQAVHYFFSGNYLNQEGVLLNSGYKNYSARANVEVNPNKKLKLGLNLAPTYSETNSPAAEGKDRQLMKLFNMCPIVEDTAGMNTGAGTNSRYAWATSSVSPVAYLKNSLDLIKTTRILYSMYGQYELLNGLDLKSTVNYDEINRNTKSYVSDFVRGNVTNYINSPGLGSSGSYGGYKKQNFVNENTLSYHKTIREKHHISAVAGMSYSYVHFESFSISTAGGYANDLVNTLNNAIPNSSGVSIKGSSAESNNVLLSYYGRVQYRFEDKYLFSASIRRDGSSRFGSHTKWGVFPSLSVGWRISEEPFMKKLLFVNDLKLRASYGRSGNNNIGDYAAEPLLSGVGYSFGGNDEVAATGQIPAGLANPDLAWETSNTYDAGLDASLLNNRINLIFDIYEKKNTKLLLRIPVPAATGFTSSLQNIGAVKNTGVEIGLNTVNIRLHDFQWTTNVNIAFNHNEVAALGPDDEPINIPAKYSGNPPFLLQKGLPMYSFYLIKTAGILTDKDMADASVAKLPKQAVGDAKYYDADGNGIIDANDRVLAGQPNPRYTWGFTNTFRYKAIDLTVQMYGQHGGYIYSFLGRAIDNPANGRNTTLGIWRDRWTADNPNPNAPRGKAAPSYKVPLFTTDWLYSSDFWRIQNITLGYNVGTLLKSRVISHARIYASIQNWFGHDKFTGGVNPEAQNTNVSGDGSFPLPGDYGAMPLNKTVTFGVNLSF